MEEFKAFIDRNFQGDKVIWSVVFLLSLGSMMVVYSATGTIAYKHGNNAEYYLLKHVLFMVMGLVAMWLCHRIDYRYYAKLGRATLWISVVLLIIAILFGTSYNSANRWLTIPLIGLTFMPSDVAKFALICTLASMLSKRQQNVESIKTTLFPLLIWVGVICGLIIFSDFSTALMLLAACVLLMFIGRVPVKYLAALALVGMLVVGLGMTLGQRGATVQSRLDHFMNDKPTDAPFQAKQSWIAVSTGGGFGKGPGQSIQKNYLPHPYSDFVFAIIVEEYGMAGAILTLGLYLLILWRGMITVAQSERAFGGLLSAGLSFLWWYKH